jgi:beta-glucosidase-like glycosyl hydrolase
MTVVPPLIPLRELVQDFMKRGGTVWACTPCVKARGYEQGDLIDGVVITDDMQMGAIANYYGFAEAIEAAVLAGADIIAISNNGTVYDPFAGGSAFEAILAAVREGRIAEARIEQSYERIMRLKARLRAP